MNAEAVFGNLDDTAEVGAVALESDKSVELTDAADAPTSVPCGITISILIEC